MVLKYFYFPVNNALVSSGGSSSLFKTAVLGENVGKNRFKDVLPYEENRVRLTQHNDKDNRTGYINASHVSATVGHQQRSVKGYYSTTVRFRRHCYVIQQMAFFQLAALYCRMQMKCSTATECNNAICWILKYDLCLPGSQRTWTSPGGITICSGNFYR